MPTDTPAPGRDPAAAPFFSVVVPVHNGHGHLPRSLGSVAAQSFRDFELVVVDDGSTDGSADLARELLRGMGGGHRVLTQANRGPLAARQAGYRAASGRYVLSLDADDELHPQALGLLAGELERRPVDLVLFDVAYRLPWPQGQAPQHPALVGEAARSVAAVRRAFAGGVGRAVREYCVSADTLRRSLVDEGRFAMRYCEDQLQTCAVLDQAQTFSYLPECLYHYRDTAQSLSKDLRPETYRDYVAVSDQIALVESGWEEPGAEPDIATLARAYGIAFHAHHVYPSVAQDELVATVQSMGVLDRCLTDRGAASLAKRRDLIKCALLAMRNRPLARAVSHAMGTVLSALRR